MLAAKVADHIGGSGAQAGCKWRSRSVTGLRNWCRDIGLSGQGTQGHAVVSGLENPALPGPSRRDCDKACPASPKLLGPVYTDLHHDLGKGCPGKCGVLTTSSSWSGTDLSPCQPARGLLTTPADCSTASPQVRSRSRATRRRNLGLAEVRASRKRSWHYTAGWRLSCLQVIGACVHACDLGAGSCDDRRIRQVIGGNVLSAPRYPALCSL
jgi:hypothetical protein